MGERCSQRIYSGSPVYGGTFCSRAGKVEHAGKWYCKQHDPVAVSARDKERREKWDKEWAAKKAAWDHKKAIADAFEGHEGEITPGMVKQLKARVAELEGALRKGVSLLDDAAEGWLEEARQASAERDTAEDKKCCAIAGHFTKIGNELTALAKPEGK